jgi:hypothetical protein
MRLLSGAYDWYLINSWHIRGGVLGITKGAIESGFGAHRGDRSHVDQMNGLGLSAWAWNRRWPLPAPPHSRRWMDDLCRAFVISLSDHRR